MKMALHATTFPVPEPIKRFSQIFHENGHCLYIVGGAVRDYLLGVPNSDYDFTTDATPQEVIAMFRKVIPTGIKHGTVSVLFANDTYEVTTFRTEGGYEDHRHPTHVQFVRNLSEDLCRRDFTINALAVDAQSGAIIDLNGGREDLQAHLIRAIGNPTLRFTEDALRILRGCRFACKLGFSIDMPTFEAMKCLAPTLSHVSQERIHVELDKIVMSATPRFGFELMEQTQVLSEILPELVACSGVEQKGMHLHDVYLHSIIALQTAADLHANKIVRYAALLHDIGKPSTRSTDDLGFYTFHGHEIASQKIARSILNRLKFSNEERDQILNLVANHMFNYTPEWTDAAVRRFIARVGVDAIEDLFTVRLCDQQAIAGAMYPDGIDELRKRVHKVLSDADALSVKDLAVNGKDLMGIGIPAGPKLGIVLNQLLETVLDDPSQNKHDTLLTIALGIFGQLLSE